MDTVVCAADAGAVNCVPSSTTPATATTFDGTTILLLLQLPLPVAIELLIIHQELPKLFVAPLCSMHVLSFPFVSSMLSAVPCWRVSNTILVKKCILVLRNLLCARCSLTFKPLRCSLLSCMVFFLSIRYDNNELAIGIHFLLISVECIGTWCNSELVRAALPCSSMVG